MATVNDILARKGSHVHTAKQDESVLQATQRMNEHQIGALVVVDHHETVVGIFTERDVLRRVVAAQLDPATTTVQQVMSRDIVCCPPETSLEDVQNLMKSQRIRHLPVMGHEGNLRGLISIGDVNASFATNQEVHLHYLREYIMGRA
jgi:CBS domain-containing protein